MKRISFADTRCSLAQSLDMIGEWWTLLIIREAYFGTRRFSDFQSHLGIARNVLSACSPSRKSSICFWQPRRRCMWVIVRWALTTRWKRRGNASYL